MATNKRKDAAALFELLDNSSLKVPKNAGSLKIPSWWSSKTNPGPTEIPDDVPDTAYEAAPIAGGVAAQEAQPHSRLFEPPPTGETPTAMPSIRPPAAPATQAAIGTTPAAKMLNNRPARSATNVVSPPKPPIDPSVPVAPKEPRIFAPQMYAQQRRPWVQPRPGAFARLPGWVLGSGAAAVVLIIVSIVFIANRQHKTAVAASPVEGRSAVTGAVVPPVSQREAATPVVQAVNSNRSPAAPVPTAALPAVVKAYGPGEVDRHYDLFYVIIASTPSKDVAEKNAQFIAGKGVAVSIEVDKKGMLHLVSVDGFPSISAAQALRTKIVEIGHLTEAYKRTHRAWDDAMVQNHLSTPK
jgi:hypothetical protein